MFTSRPRIFCGRAQLREPLLQGESAELVTRPWSKRTLLGLMVATALASCAILFQGKDSSASLRGSGLSFATSLTADDQGSFFGNHPWFAALCGIGLMTLFVCLKQAYQYARWYLYPDAFQIEAQACGVLVHTFWIIAHQFLTPDLAELADKTDEELHARYHRLTDFDCISEEQKKCVVVWRERCKVIIAKEDSHKHVPGLVDLWKHYPLKRRFTIVLVGWTGAGKTSLLNLLNAISCVTGELTPEAIDRFARKRKEDIQAGPAGMSHTKYVTIYDIDVGGIYLRVVDCPGYEDTDSKDNPMIDAEHEKNIIAELQQLEVINCLIIAMKCTSNRYTMATEKVLAMIAATLPKEFLRNILFLFTNANEDTDVSVPLDQIARDFLEGNVPESCCLNNPHAKLNHKDSWKMTFEKKEAAIRLGLTQIINLLDLIKDFELVPTQRFQNLLDQRESIAKRLEELHAGFKTENDLALQLEEIKLRAESNMSQPVVRCESRMFKLKKATRIDEGPNFPIRCLDVGCGWYRESKFLERNWYTEFTCEVCGQSAVIDGYFYKQDKQVLALPVIDPAQATSLDTVEIFIADSNRKRELMCNQIQEAIEHYESLGLRHAFGNHLESLFLAVRQGLRSDNPDLQALQSRMESRLAAFIEIEQKKPKPVDERLVFNWNELI